MILGQVNSFLEGVIPVELRTPTGGSLGREGTIDTGFSGYLSLPPDLIAQLQLVFFETRVYTLADQTDVALDLYHAIAVWDSHDRSILVLSTEGDPLVGMSMLRGFLLFMDVIEGGEVRIEARP